ncbi:MAG: hypothetical protein AMXMBFR84_08630 [Candidatus Hydrogenedentota bacterium]
MAATISIAMIVKDEAGHLAECLDSAKSLADEICIVDTGSNDSTVSIARKFGAHVSVFLWCDDFSAARNESLRLCTKDWIFILDADERLQHTDIARVRELTRGPTDRCYRFVTHNYTNTASVSEFNPVDPNSETAAGFAGWYPSAKVRLFPNHKGAIFEGKVHELVNPSLERLGIRVLDTNVPIHHYPLINPPDRIRDKQLLYLKLGHEKAKEDPTNPKVYTELGAQYAEVGAYEEAAAAYKEAVRLRPSDPKTLNDLGAVLHLMKKEEEAQRALRIAIQLDPNLAEAWRNLGVVLAEEQIWEAALECFDKALALDPAWQDGNRYRSVALQGTGHLREAAHAAQLALETNPHSQECLSLFVHQMLRLEKREQARAVIGKIISNGAEDPELENALGELCYYDNLYAEARNHFQRSGEAGLAAGFNNLGVVHFKERHYELAKAAYEKCLAIDPGHRGARSGLEKVIKHLEK